MMPLLPLKLLHAHPGNANRMSRETFNKLTAHIDASGEYPPIIVRPHPAIDGAYQILDGHHRVQALRHLGHDSAHCVIWQADDRRAALLLLTLNRLHGEDAPHKRADLLRTLAAETDIASLAQSLPDSEAEIARLLNLTKPTSPAAPTPLTEMPHAITFFLNKSQRDALLARLAPLAKDRSEALSIALELDSTHPECTES
ncbi:MAG TPA: ParB N-terminal domain-containing protein [Phycisphaerales bacterium]|nr:ParB N-terminal domain-containing protein [Phycisphaerales bacterium]